VDFPPSSPTPSSSYISSDGSSASSRFSNFTNAK
jgi:hypothetical protein